MKTKSIFLSAMVYVVAVVNVASADTIHGIDIDFVSIGNAGNAGDTRGGGYANPYGCGAVSYDYRIGKYEVTNAQWNAFTAIAGTPTGNNGGYDHSSYYTGAQQPTTCVSWYETLQFCNYLTSGDKSKGVYQFSGNNANPGSFIRIDRAAAQATYVTTYFLPTEDEWYKAAYYTGGYSPRYSLYANGTDIAPIAGVNTNYGNSTAWDVGTGTQEQNGTFDMMGNVWERNETLIGSGCGIRGGSYADGHWLKSSSRLGGINLYGESGDSGFRVASVPGRGPTLLVQTEPNDITTVTPSVGQHTCSGWVDVNASRFADCPDVYQFDHWEGDVNDPNSADTTVLMDSDKTITAVFVVDRQCGDECHPYPSGDVNKDCKVDFLDIAIIAGSWLECTRPECD